MTTSARIRIERFQVTSATQGDLIVRVGISGDGSMAVVASVAKVGRAPARKLIVSPMERGIGMEFSEEVTVGDVMGAVDAPRNDLFHSLMAPFRSFRRTVTQRWRTIGPLKIGKP